MLNGFTEMMKGFWNNQDLEVPNLETPCKQEPCGDTISRQAAIDALWKALYEYEDKKEKQFQESDELDVSEWMVHRIFVQDMSDIDRQTILNLPSTQPEWIPVDKELPEDRTKCLVTQKFGRVRQVSKATYACDLYKVNQYDFCDKKNTAGFYYFDDEYGYVEALGVTAWMPEPEPYEGV